MKGGRERTRWPLTGPSGGRDQPAAHTARRLSACCSKVSPDSLAARQPRIPSEVTRSRSNTPPPGGGAGSAASRPVRSVGAGLTCPRRPPAWVCRRCLRRSPGGCEPRREERLHLLRGRERCRACPTTRGARGHTCAYTYTGTWIHQLLRMLTGLVATSFYTGQ